MRAAVLGKPIAHSLSPVLHRAAYQALGLTEWTYDLVECDEAGLAGYVRSRGKDWARLKLDQVPLKWTVLPLLDHVDQRRKAAATGGANKQVFWSRGPLQASNTDVQVASWTRSAEAAGLGHRAASLSSARARRPARRLAAAR